VVDILPDNKGVFTVTKDGSELLTGDLLDTFNLTFTPSAGLYSKPANVPLGVMTFRVVDGDGFGLTSPVYTARVFVRFVPLNITYRNDTVVTIDEDTSALITLDRDGTTPSILALNSKR